MTDARGAARTRTFGAERAKAFIDAVVAIAMTLLILPLMESVGEAAHEQLGAWGWLNAESDALLSFVLSFVIIAMFWMSHHRLFSTVETVTNGLLWITMAWLLSIVWLPVATSLSGQMSSADQGVKALYIGSMILTAVLSIVTRAYLLRHPALHRGPSAPLLQGMAADVAMAILFGVALTVALVVPSWGYYPMFVMFLVGPLQALIARGFGVQEHRHPR